MRTEVLRDIKKTEEEYPIRDTYSSGGAQAQAFAG